MTSSFFLMMLSSKKWPNVLQEEFSSLSSSPPHANFSFGCKSPKMTRMKNTAKKWMTSWTILLPQEVAVLEETPWGAAGALEAWIFPTWVTRNSKACWTIWANLNWCNFLEEEEVVWQLLQTPLAPDKDLAVTLVAPLEQLLPLQVIF